MTNSRVWANFPPPFRTRTVISFPNDRRAVPVPDGGFGAPRRMSTNNRILVMIGLTVVGSLGWAAVRERPMSPSRRRPTPRPPPRRGPGTIPAVGQRSACSGHRLAAGLRVSGQPARRRDAVPQESRRRDVQLGSRGLPVPGGATPGSRLRRAYEAGPLVLEPEIDRRGQGAAHRDRPAQSQSS